MEWEVVPASGGWRIHYKDRANGKIIFWSRVYNDLRDVARAITLGRRYARTAPVNRRALRRVS